MEEAPCGSTGLLHFSCYFQLKEEKEKVFPFTEEGLQVNPSKTLDILPDGVGESSCAQKTAMWLLPRAPSSRGVTFGRHRD